MAERKLSLVILGKATGALAALKATGDGAKSLGDRVTDMLPSFKTVALAGAAAFGAIAASAYGAVQAAAQDEESQKKLADQLRRTTQATDEQIAAVEQHISKQMMLTGTTDDALRPAMANLVRATGDVGFAQQQLNLALDISAATGKDLESVSLALGKAFTGNVGALTKLGIPLDQSVIKSKNLGEVISTLNTQFGGAAADAADTFSGRLRILRVSLSEAVEGIGYALLPFAERLVAFIQTHILPVIQAFSDKLAAGGGLRDALVAAAAQAGDFGVRVVDIVEKIAKAFATFANIMITIGRPILYLVGAIASGLVLIFTRSITEYRGAAMAFKSLHDEMGTMKISTDDIGVAFQNFRNDVLGAAAATNLTQQQLRLLDQQARQTASGTANVVQPFIGPMLAGYGAAATGAKTATDLAKEFAETLKKLQESAGGAGGKVKQVADAMKTYTDVLTKARDATRSATDATKGVTKARDDLNAKTKAVTDAQTRFDLVVGGFPATAKESIDATDTLASANRRLRDAGLAVTDAQVGVRNAEKRLAELRAIAPDPDKIAAANRRLRDAVLSQTDAVYALKQAEQRLADLRAITADPESVAAAERSLERSKYAVEEANFSVIDAENKLAELRSNPDADPIEVRRAEIRLAEAKLSVFDSVRNISQAEKQLAEERNKSATPEQIADAERDLAAAQLSVGDSLDEIRLAEKALAEERAVAPKADDLADAERELERAKLAVNDALEDQTSATIEQGKAQKELNEITNGATVGSLVYKAALKALDDAKKEQQDASESLTDALRQEADAMRELVKAQEALLAAQANTKPRVVAAAAAALGVAVGPGGTISELIGTVTASGGSAGGTTNGTLNVRVETSTFVNPQEVGAEIVEALDAYLRSNGTIPIPVGAFASDR
jgi:hypothetical protein